MKKYILLLSLFLAACGAPAASTDVDMLATSAYLTSHNALVISAMTATAEAPYISIAQTQAAWEIDQQQQAAAIANASTATAQMWTPTPDITQTVAASDARATLAANEMAITNQKLELERARQMNQVNAILPAVATILIIVVVLIFALVLAFRLSNVVMPIDAHGNPQPVMRVVDGRVVDVLPIRAQIAPAVELPALPAPKQETQQQPAHILPAPAVITPQELFPLPAWTMFTNWNGTGPLPISISADGALEYWDYNLHAHVSVFGKTGSGKSRRFLRPLIAAMLTSGAQVVIIGKHLDFMPFANHPNAYTLPLYELSDEAQAQKYADALTALVMEKNTRAQWLAENKLSTWQQAGKPNTFIVLDELSNALHEMPKELAQKSFGRLVSLINEGRKTGMSVVFSSQRAKGFIDLTSQCGRIVFMVSNDQESQYVLGTPGAEQLPAGYFYSKFTSRKLMGAFHPSDDEITAYLNTRTAPQLPRLHILDLNAQPAIEDKTKMEDDETTRILALHAQGKAESAIVREMYETTGGGKFLSKLNHVRRVIKSATTTGAMPAETITAHA